MEFLAVIGSSLLLCAAFFAGRFMRAGDAEIIRKRASREAIEKLKNSLKMFMEDEE
jgi:hypothetical protein